jgi:GTP cyclohydrolase I
MEHKKPTREEAEEAVRTLIRWAGDDPARESLKDTPKRVVNSYSEIFAGYNMTINEKISRSFCKKPEFDDIVMLDDIRLESVCEHHMLPIIGRASVAYIPNSKVLGISKLARIVDYHAKRLQMQERLVVEIAETLSELIAPKGVAVYIEAKHHCMTTRGVHKDSAVMKSMHMEGLFKEKTYRNEFILMLKK